MEVVGKVHLRSTSSSAWVKSCTSSLVMLCMGTPSYPLSFKLRKMWNNRSRWSYLHPPNPKLKGLGA